MSSLIISLILGILLFLFAFDKSGFAYMLLIPAFVVLGFPSLLFKLSSDVSFRIGYWDMLTWATWFGFHLYYSMFLWTDKFWYANYMSVNKLISSFLIIIPIIMIIYLIAKRSQMTFW